MKITEKAAYLKGLADGLELDTATKEGKLIAALLDMVDAMAQKIDEMDHDIEELNDYIEKSDFAIASPCPRSSAPIPGYAPFVSIKVIIGLLNFSACFIKRIAFL